MSSTSSTHIYHRHLDPDSDDSLAQLARWIAPGSTVLDLGSGPGVLGRYLSEQRHCKVDGIEVNPAAVAQGRSGYRNLQCADLEQIALAEAVAGAQYDYIVCADILEHLRQPELLLKQLPPLLTERGRILLSVPNVGYAGLIGELLAGDFCYRLEGLLDETHLRFFTRISLLRLLEQCGLQALECQTTVAPIAVSEFAHTWQVGGWAEQQPAQVLSALLDRTDALTYQFLINAAPLAEVPTVPTVTALRLAIAIVTYAPDWSELTITLQRLAQALLHAQQRGLLSAGHVIVVDNGPGPAWREPLQSLLASIQLPARVVVLSGHGNVGYAAAHNLAFYHADSAVHLVLNPDVWLAEDALSVGLSFLAAHPDAGLVAPAALDVHGQVQYLCKRYPTVLDLALRGFAPHWLRRHFEQRLGRYELRAQAANSVLWDPPIASGCCMLVRRSALTRVGGFCADYFLYFEDFDLSLRLAAVTRLAYVPQMRITHLGGHAAGKGWRHIAYFGRSALRFFNRHGWRWW